MAAASAAAAVRHHGVVFLLSADKWQQQFKICMNGVREQTNERTRLLEQYKLSFKANER